MSNPSHPLTFSDLLKKYPATRYFAGKDQMAENLIEFMKGQACPTGICLFGEPYDRLAEVSAQIEKAGESALIEAIEKETLTRALHLAELERTPQVRVPDSLRFSLDPGKRLAGHLLTLKCINIIITHGEMLSPSQFRALNKAVEILRDYKSSLRILLVIEGAAENYDPIINNGSVTWSFRVCPKLNYNDILGFFQARDIRLEAEEATVAVIASFCNLRPQRLELIAGAARRLGIATLGATQLMELLPSLDSTAQERAKKRGYGKAVGPAIESSRTRGRLNNLRGQMELKY